MKKSGFTLIELLAVIIILAIVALIATPLVLDVIDDARKSAYNSSAHMIIDGARNYYVESMLDTTKTGIDGKTNLFNEVAKNMQGEMPDSGEIYINERGQVAVSLVFNKTCYIKDFKSSNLLETEDTENCKVTYTDLVLNGADPELDSAMIPVVINTDGSVSKADTRTAWYDYTEKRWANVVLVSDESRNEYISAEPGTAIESSDIKAYYVWIPRYKYQIFTDVNNIASNSSLATTNNIPNNYVNKAQIINVEFEDKEATKSTGSAQDEWLTHPAFTFGNEELNGIWVGKYETTGTASAPTVLPYTASNIQQSLRSQNVSTQFATSQKIAYGLNSKEASMLKNSEWGAVAYLTASAYGQGTEEVRINNSEYYYTGCAATTPALNETYGEYNKTQTDGSEGSYQGCENEWYTSIGVLASTTGNVYGVYDMSGGAWEYVMGVMEDSLGSGVPASGRNNDYNSGFTGTLTYPNDGSDPSITSINGVAFPDSKYYDLYTYNTSSVVYANRGHLGDATYELNDFVYWQDPDGNTRYHSSWNKDYAHFVSYGYPWFARGGGWHGGASAGVFGFYSSYGHAYSNYSFRSVLR